MVVLFKSKKMCSIARVVFMVVMVITSLFSRGTAFSADASYYVNYVPSTCFGSQNEGNMVAAVNELLYRNGNACGLKYSVRCVKQRYRNTCRGNTFVTVKIVDFCPSTNCSTAITLSKEAFSQIAYPAFPVIRVDVTQA